MKMTKSFTIGKKRAIDDDQNTGSESRHTFRIGSNSFDRAPLSDISNGSSWRPALSSYTFPFDRNPPSNQLDGVATRRLSLSIPSTASTDSTISLNQTSNLSSETNNVDHNCTENDFNPSVSRTRCQAHRLKKRKPIFSMSQSYWDIGDAKFNCSYCGAFFWYEERLSKTCNSNSPKYGTCCSHGKISLHFLKRPPAQLEELLFGDSERSKLYKQNIRSYNNMFCFTSMGGKIDNSINRGGSPPIFKLHGQNYHLIGSLLPKDGETPKFAQLYIYDTENEVANRKSSVRPDSAGDDLHDDIVEDLKNMLDEHNVLVRSFRMAREKIFVDGATDVRLKLIGRRSGDGRLYNLPSVSEVAALVVGDFDGSVADRDILIETRPGDLQRITQLNPSYLGLQYPLLFPYGEDGFREDIPFSNVGNGSKGRKKISLREFFVYRLHGRINDAKTLLFSRRLSQQFFVDAYTMVESSRLTYIRSNQKQLRSEMYRGLQDALFKGDCDASKQGKRIILPSSFTGGARYMIQNYQDAMAICKWVGYPDLFFTMTCNPKWPEIVRFLDENELKAEDRPDILCRIFKAKLDGLVRDIRKNKIFGEVKSVIYTIEFQKRGLPHAHILIFLATNFKSRTTEEIDGIISAEIPDENEDPEYYEAVKELMVHGPCGMDKPNSPCMVDGRCSKHYPKKFNESTKIDDDGFVVYRRRDNGRTITKNGVTFDNRHVVPHNRYLLITYGAHLNVEWCNQSRAIKYLFKYIHKGNDHVTVTFIRVSGEESSEQIIDEVKLYYDCRYVSSCEAVWRIFGFEIQYKDPPVERLSFHLPNEQNVVFSDSDNIQRIMQRESVGHSMFMAWMEANKLYEDARKLTYAEFPTKFVWKADIRQWVPRKKGFAIGRIFFVPPGSGDMYYLRCLLNKVRGATCFSDLTVVNGNQCGTYRNACYELGLLNDDKEYIDGIKEASDFATASSLRSLFVRLLISSSISRPEVVWESCWTYLSDDVLYNQRRILNHPGLTLTETEIRNYALAEIEKLLRVQGRSLREFCTMPFPDSDFFQVPSNRLIYDEMNYNRSTMKEEYNSLVGNLNDDQRQVYQLIVDSCSNDIGKMFFVYGYGGSGKTYVWRTLSSFLRSEGRIVLNVASSGIASLLLPGGRTAHSRFSIPFNLTEDSVCNIRQGSPLAELIIKADLVIWDEAPMMHKHCFEALDRSMRDIMRVRDARRNDFPFGGKTVVFGGDFRQILPVIPKGSRQDIVRASINSSYLWRHCVVLRLTKNMRLQRVSDSVEGAYLKQFSMWLENIGDGKINEPNDGVVDIEIPDEFLVKGFTDPIVGMVDTIYPDFLNAQIDSSYFKERAILAPTLDVVDAVNDYMVSLNESVGRTYLSSDFPCHSDQNVDLLSDLHTPEFLNSISMSGLPNHVLNLKVGIPVMLLRNIDPSLGLCNGTRLVITRLGNHVLEGEVLTSSNNVGKVLIPRMSLTPSDVRIPFKFERRQFPLMVSYAMSINKSQGQSLSTVGLLLKKPVFCHGQLYVALSRVTNPKGLKILIVKDEGECSSCTTNVVYKEVFQNL